MSAMLDIKILGQVVVIYKGTPLAGLTRLGTRADVQLAKDYLLAVQQQAGIALGNNYPYFGQFFYENGPSPWNILDNFLDKPTVRPARSQ